MEGEPTVIVLAAGRGDRAGVPKGLVDVQGAPWLERQLDRLAECGLARAVVVLGHAFEEHVAEMPWVAAAVAKPIPLLGLRIEVARNAAPERGPFSSLLCALERASGGAAYVLPVDIPCPGRPVWDALAGALAKNVLAAVPARDGHGGHPVLLSRALVERLRAVSPDAGDARLDAQLRGLPAGAVARVACDDVRAFTNLNTPEDWASLA